MPASKTPPIQRHPALQPLSRDHYVALVQAQHLIKAAAGNSIDRRAAVAAFLDVWDTEMDAHFMDEERLLIPLMAEDDTARLRREHERIRAAVNEAREHRRQIDPGVAWTRKLGQRLNDHTRWEERELFPAVEQRATPDQLNTLREQTDRLEAARPRCATPG